MDAFVTARVPVEIKEQGNAALKRIGATPTQLVNAAYEYVLAHGALPGAQNQGSDHVVSGKQQLTGAAAQELAQSLQETTFALPAEAWNASLYDKLIAEGRAHDYEALS